MAPNPASIFTRPKAQCEGCHSLERHRLLYELLCSRQYLDGRPRVLHIAPELGLARVLYTRLGENYVAYDIDPDRYPHVPVKRIDLCRDLTAFCSESFDIVIHNHVLEHLECDYKEVLRQLDRLVAPRGVHAFTVPFMDSGFFRESFSFNEAARLEHFGQTDHVRVFGTQDLTSTIGSVVNVPEPYDATLLLTADRLREIAIPREQWHGYNNNAVFFIEKIKSPTPATSRPSQVAVRSQARPPVCRPTALFVSANGVGRGHLSRQIAIAHRLSRHSAMFLTMSYAARMIAANGFPFQFFPHHAVTGEPTEQWHRILANEIELILDMTGADTLVYDVNFVFDGVIDVLRRRRDSLRSLWVRRAMWPAIHHSYVGAGVHFSTIVEPGDLAEALDDGPTVGDRASVVRVPPVLLTDPSERLSRQDARTAMALPPDHVVIMIDLLSTALEPFARLRNRILRNLLGRRNICVVELEPIQGSLESATADQRHRILRIDSAFRYSRAWDGAVTRCGYNIFHEHVLGGVPTVFVPNEAPEMDRQSLRSGWAEQRGYGLGMTVDPDATELATKLDLICDKSWRERVATECDRLRASGRQNGAHVIAGMIDVIG